MTLNVVKNINELQINAAPRISRYSWKFKFNTLAGDELVKINIFIDFNLFHLSPGTQIITDYRSSCKAHTTNAQYVVGN